MACTFTHVSIVFGSNTNCWQDFLIDSSTILKKRRTLMERHSLSFPFSVRAPQTRQPYPGKVRITLIDFPELGSMLRLSCSRDEMGIVGPATENSASFAGAFQTPFVESMRAYRPAIAGDGGSSTYSLPTAALALAHSADPWPRSLIFFPTKVGSLGEVSIVRLAKSKFSP